MLLLLSSILVLHDHRHLESGDDVAGRLAVLVTSVTLCAGAVRDVPDDVMFKTDSEDDARLEEEADGSIVDFEDNETDLDA